MAGFVVDTFMVYQFLRRLVQPFTSWKAYDLGIIDANGKILKGKKERNTIEERGAFRIFDLMILKLKKLLGSFPGGKSRLASFAAAAFLIKEGEALLTPNNDSLLYEALETGSDIENTFLDFYQDNEDEFTKLFGYSLFGEDLPANVASSGAIAGIGVGPQGEPPGRLPRKKKKKKKDKNYGI
ncbi:hypothetical protein KAR91_79260 [Candidatus Pacearchaeota archaeon]|nr:hypothetical protein [Candidatus Pacearchaeota archaeon]